MKKLLIIPDTHVPYHDRKAFKLLLKVGFHLQPDYVIICGDFADFYAVSSHDKNPDRRKDLLWEVEEVKAALDMLKRLGATYNYYVSGNHEDRLTRYLSTRAPELFGMVDIPGVLNLTGWKYIPYKEYLRIGKLHITHDTGKSGQNAIHSSQADFESNVVIGHTHRMDYIIKGNAKGEPHVGASFGWLGDANKVDYMHRVKVNRDWALGFGVGYMEPNGVVHLQPVPIVGYKCVVGGKLFS